MRKTQRLLAIPFLLLLCPAALLAQNWSGTGSGNSRAQKIAEGSLPARNSISYIKQQIASMRNARLRRLTADFIANPAPTYQTRSPLPADRERVLKELSAAGLISAETSVEGVFVPVNNPQKGAQSFLAAPGSYYATAKTSAGHHAYPGGLPVHTAYNLRAGLDMIKNYRLQYAGFTPGSAFAIDRDVVICAIVLHDVMKTLVFQWNEDGSQFLEQRIAGTGAHHVLAIAEMYARGFPPEAIVAMASAHNPTAPTEQRRIVVGYLRAGAIIARVDPVAYGTLKALEEDFDVNSEARPEHFIVNLSDADYFYSGHAAASTVDLLRHLAGQRLKWSTEQLQGAHFNWLRNRLLARYTEMGLYQLYLERSSPDSLIKLLE